jgi:hypothetical protein
MSFDWDSIKVINNPDLKEIETLFTPNSELSGTESDPTEGVGPPLGQPDGGGDDGGDNGGGDNGGGVIDCQPPEDAEECLGHDCYAFNDFASELPNPDSVLAIPTYDSSFPDSGGIYPGFRLLDSSGTVQPVINSLILANEGSDTPICNPLQVYGHRVGTTSTASSVSYIPDGVFEDLGAQVPNGQSRSYSGKMSAYMYGISAAGDITFVPSNDKFIFAETSLQAYKDGLTNQGCSASRIQAEMWNDTTDGKAYGRLFETEFVINEDSTDLSGVYTVEWTATVTNSGGSPLIETSMRFTGPNFDETVTRTATPNGDWVADSYVTLSTYGQHSFPKYFNNAAQPSFSPKALYIADTSVVDEVDFKLACERSLSTYTAPEDCVPWVRPEGCPDCSKPDECVGDCDALTTALTNGTPGVTAIWGKTQANGWTIPQAANPDDTSSTFYANGIGGPSGMPASDLYFENNIDQSYRRINAVVSTISTSSKFFKTKAHLDCGSLLSDSYNVIRCSSSPHVIAPEFDISKFGGATSQIYDRANWGQLTGDHQGTYAYECSIYLDFDTNDNATLCRLNSGWSPTFYTKKTNSTQTTGLTAPVIDISSGREVTLDYGTPNEQVIDTSTTGVTGWYKLKVNGGWNIAEDNDNPVGKPSPEHVKLSAVATFQWDTPFGTFTATKDMGIDTTSWLDAASYNGKPIFPSQLGLPGIQVYGAGSSALIHAATPNHLTAPDLKYWEQSRLEFAPPQECIDYDFPEGCPDTIYPDNPCPCSCRGQSYDPLGCSADVITGGLYDLTGYPARLNGTFPNYDGSQGRVVYWEDGGGTNDSYDQTEMMDVAFDENNSYRVLGNRDSYDGTQRGYVDPTADIRGIVSTGSAANGTFEFCALVGYVDNPITNTNLVIPADVVGDGFANNGRVNFTRESKFKQISGSRTWISQMGDFNVSFQRRGPSTVSYQRSDTGGASTRIEVTLPRSVLDPEDKFVWFSAKVFVQAQELGSAKDTIPGFTNPTYWAYKTSASADLYVNGFLIASGVRVHRKSGYLNDEFAHYVVENTGFNPAVLQTTIFDDNNPLDNNDFVPKIWTQDPNTGNERLFIAFMDTGPGASLIPASEQGRNLARIDPNNTPYADCSGCA